MNNQINWQTILDLANNKAVQQLYQTSLVQRAHTHTHTEPAWNVTTTYTNTQNRTVLSTRKFADWHLFMSLLLSPIDQSQPKQTAHSNPHEMTCMQQYILNNWFDCDQVQSAVDCPLLHFSSLLLINR